MSNKKTKRSTLDDFFKNLTDKEEAINCLKKHEIADVESIDEIQQYERPGERNGLILSVKEQNNDNHNKILIDIKSGQPCIDQVYDAIYDIGEGCSKRVIMFTGGCHEIDIKNPAADEWVIANLIKAMNVYPLGLYLVKLGSAPGQSELLGDTNQSPKYAMSDVPSKEKFREAEFWSVFFDSLYTYFYISSEVFKYDINQNKDFGYWMGSCALDSHCKWSDDGAIFTAIQTDDDEEVFLKIWKTREIELQRLFYGLEMKLIYLPGKLPKIKIKFWDFSPARLVELSTNEKISYAESLHENYGKFFTFMEENVYDLRELQKKKKMEKEKINQ